MLLCLLLVRAIIPLKNIAKISRGGILRKDAVASLVVIIVLWPQQRTIHSPHPGCHEEVQTWQRLLSSIVTRLARGQICCSYALPLVQVET